MSKKAQSGPPPPRPVFADSSGQLFRQNQPVFKANAKGTVSPRPPMGVAGGQVKLRRGEPNKKGISEPGFEPIGGSVNDAFSGGGKYGPANRIDKSKYDVSIDDMEMEGTPAEIPSYDPKKPKKNAVPNDKNLKKSAKELNAVAPPGERLAYVNPSEEALLKAVGGSGKPSSGGVPSYKKGDVEAPPPRDYYQEMLGTLMGQRDMAPLLFESESQFRPQYANLERGIMLENLGIDPSVGLLEAYEDYIIPSQVAQKRKSVEGDISMVRDLGQELIKANREADPEAEALRQSVLSGAQDMVSRSRDAMDGDLLQSLRGRIGGGIEADLMEEYQAGGGLTESESRDLDQQMLGYASSRGTIGQSSSDFARMKAKLDGDRQVRQSRLNNLMGVRQQNLANYQTANQQAYSNYGQSLRNASASYQLGAQDPLLALTGRASRVPGDASAQFGTAGFTLQSAPTIFNPESAYAGALHASNQQNEMNARTATASNRAGMFSGLLGLGGSLGGGYLAGRA